MRILFVILALVAVAMPARAANGTVIHVGVDGMVCDICAQSLIKIFKQEQGVDKIDISLEKKLMTITLKSGATLSDEAIRKHIDYAGYKVANIHRMTDDKHDQHNKTK
jgi:copper chaperone CopZ